MMELRQLGVFGGHVAVLRLLKRVLLVGSTARPGEVEVMVDGPPMEALDERVTEWRNGEPEIQIKVWTPRHGKEKGKHGRYFHETAKRVLGHDVEMQDATRQQLYKMAAFLVHEIDKHPPRDDWYPDGWRDVYDPIKATLNQHEQELAAQ